jgi:hypothetical protein
MTERDIPTLPAGSENYISKDFIEDSYSRHSEGITLLVLFGITADKKMFQHESIDGGKTWSEAVAIKENAGPSQPSSN